jgi:hypothetical protein
MAKAEGPPAFDPNARATKLPLDALNTSVRDRTPIEATLA